MPSVSILGTPVATEFDDENFDPVSFSSMSGTITVTAASPFVSTPEPGAIGLLFAGAGSLLGWRFVRRVRTCESV